MSRVIKLTWQDGQGRRPGRWRKVYHGIVYVFPGGRGRSDQEAYRAALEAFEAKKREVDLADDRIHEPAYLKCLAEWQEILGLASEHGDQAFVPRAENQIADLRRRLNEQKLPPLKEQDWFQNAVFGVPGHQQWLDKLVKHIGLVKPLEPGAAVVEPMTVVEDAQAAVWRDRLAYAARQAQDNEKSLKAAIDGFIKSKKALLDAGQLSTPRYYALEQHLRHFLDTVGNRPAEGVNGRLLIAYKEKLLAEVGKGWTSTTAQHYLRDTLTLVRWMWGAEYLDGLPRVMGQKDFMIAREATEITTIALDDLRAIFNAASPRTRLYVLLASNCALGQKDISDLRRSELDLQAGTLSRKRSKTRNEPHVPVVCYRLWPQTLKALKAEMTADGDRLLLNHNGRPLLRTEMVGAQMKKSDAVRYAFLRVCDKLKLKASFYQIRKTGATLLRAGPFADCRQVYLGHAPTTIADKSYSKIPVERFHEALEWLRLQVDLTRGGDRHEDA